MKSNRIFITNDPAYSEKEFKGIDLDDVVKRLASVRESLAEAKLPEGLRDQLEFGTVEAETEDATEKTAKKELPEALKEHQFKSKDDKGDDDDKGEEEEEEVEAEMVKRGKEAKATRTRRLLFNDPAQISAAALRVVEASGDENLARAIKSVRNEARQHLASKLDEQAQRLAEKNNKAVKRNSVRMKVVENTKTAAKVIETAAASTNETETTMNNNEPTPVSKLSAADREIAMRKASLNGWSEEYINAFFGNTEDPSVTEIKSVMASALPSSTKAKAIEGLVKVASLDDANINRLKKYWKEELGYGDEAWIDDLFTKKYDK